MAKESLTDCGLYLDEFELSRALNRIDLEGAAELPEVSSFGATNREFMKGLPAAVFSAAGFLDPENADDPIFAEWSGTTSGAILTALAKNETGGVAFFFRGCVAQYGWGMPFGGAATATLGGQASQPPFVRGKCLFRATAADASDDSTGIEFPAVADGQSIYATLHVFAADGTTPTLDVVIESDTADTFASATTRLTFTQADDVTSEWVEDTPSGGIADTFWRISYTLGGTSPEFGFVVAFGIAGTASS